MATDDEVPVNEFIPDSLDYFSPRNINEAYEHRMLDKINPMSGCEGKDGGSLKFTIFGTDWFLDLSDSYISMTLKLVGHGRNQATASVANLGTTQLSVINNIAHSIFQSVKVKVGNETITYTDTDYPYKAYLQILFNGSKESHEIYFPVAGFKKDLTGFMDGMIDATTPDNTQNTALLARRKEFFSAGDGAEGEFIIKPHTGICFANKHIPPYLDVEFELQRSDNPAFYLMEAANANFRIQILDPAFHVRKYKVKPNLVFGLERALNETKLIKFDFTEARIARFSIPSGTINYTNDSFILGKIPLRIIIGLVAAEAFAGDKDKNPFNFQHFKRTNIRLLKNGVEYPEPEIITNFATGVEPKYLKAYHSLMTSVNAAYSRDVPQISKAEFKDGYFLTNYNMSPDGESALDLHNSAYKPSNIRLELTFGTALTGVVEMLVYYEVITQMTIDYKRKVTVMQQ